MTPCSCAASSASPICFAIGRASSSGMAPRVRRCARSSPSTRFHHEGADASAVLQAVDVRDVWVVQRSEDLSFSLEPGEPIGIVGKGIRQHLQRDVAIQLRVARAVHLAHAASAERRDNLIGANSGAGSESQEDCADYTASRGKAGSPTVARSERRPVGKSRSQKKAVASLHKSLRTRLWTRFCFSIKHGRRLARHSAPKLLRGAR
jgi:hypothetical protein